MVVDLRRPLASTKGLLLEAIPPGAERAWTQQGQDTGSEPAEAPKPALSWVKLSAAPTQVAIAMVP
jgi:hypothetical protein